MKRIAYFMVLCLMTGMAAAATGRRAMSDQFMAGSRSTASKAQVAAMPTLRKTGTNFAPVTATESTDVDKTDQETVDRREKEKNACLNNNIGLNNTFVWASRYSNTGNYSAMVEDIDNPENNVCFVRVELKSDDNRINVSDVAPVYFPMGQTITCGAWADEDMIEKRILDAKKSGRTWGTVAGVVGGAGVGVGAMELFGNKLIGGKVEGQKALSESELLRSQLLVLKKDDQAMFNKIRDVLLDLQAACEDDAWASNTLPKECTKYDYNMILRDIVD